MSKPNVLLFITDGHRTDALGCYGNPLIRTPNLDAFGQETGSPQVPGKQAHDGSCATARGRSGPWQACRDYLAPMTGSEQMPHCGSQEVHLSEVLCTTADLEGLERSLG